MFSLVETHAHPSSDEFFKRMLKDDETFEMEFIGASEQDCQNWAREKAFQVDLIEHGLIAIADERSAEDGTLLIQYYRECAVKYGRYGRVPREPNTWLNFRVD